MFTVFYRAIEHHPGNEPLLLVQDQRITPGPSIRSQDRSNERKDQTTLRTIKCITHKKNNASYLLEIRLRIPCCPSKISCKNEQIMTQTMGLTSTPNAGGTTALVGLKIGSVGQATRFCGALLRSTCRDHPEQQNNGHTATKSLEREGGAMERVRGGMRSRTRKR